LPHWSLTHWFFGRGPFASGALKDFYRSLGVAGFGQGDRGKRLTLSSYKTVQLSQRREYALDVTVSGFDKRGHGRFQVKSSFHNLSPPGKDGATKHPLPHNAAKAQSAQPNRPSMLPPIRPQTLWEFIAATVCAASKIR
jgi:hypothetical protein